MDIDIDWTSVAITGGFIALCLLLLCCAWCLREQIKNKRNCSTNEDRNDDEIRVDIDNVNSDALQAAERQPNAVEPISVVAIPTEYEEPVKYEDLLMQQEELGLAIKSSISPSAYSTMLSVQTENDRCSAEMASTSNGKCPELEQVPWSDIKRERSHWENPFRNHRYESNTVRDGKCPRPNCQPIKRTARFNHRESDQMQNVNNQSERQQPTMRSFANQSKGQHWTDRLNGYMNNRKPPCQQRNIDSEVQRAKALYSQTRRNREQDHLSAAMASTWNDNCPENDACPELEQVPWSDIKQERSHWENPLRFRRDESKIAHDGNYPSPNCPSVKNTTNFNFQELNSQNVMQEGNNQSKRQQPIKTIDNQSKGQHWKYRLNGYRNNRKPSDQQSTIDFEVQRATQLCSQTRRDREQQSRCTELQSRCTEENSNDHVEHLLGKQSQIPCESLHALCLAQGIMTVRHLLQNERQTTPVTLDKEYGITESKVNKGPLISRIMS